MNKLVPIGLGAAAVVVALVIGTRLLAPAPSGPGGPAEPTATTEPSVAAPSPSDSGTASPAASPPPLTQTFTSPLHGLSVSYPEGWIAEPATELWTDETQHPNTLDLYADDLYDPVLTDHLLMSFTSRPLGDSTPDEWVAEQMAGECAATEPIAVDGATGLMSANDCEFTGMVAVATAGRGYWIILRRSNDDPDAVAPYDQTWFEEVLATVQLQPEDAVDVAPSATP